MTILQKVSLRNYSTMRLGGVASYLSEVTNRNELVESVTWAKQKNLPILMIGTGSNIVWKDEGYKGLILVNKIMGFEEDTDDPENLYLTIGAGENWDSVVARATEMGYSGIECLSLIPGTAGATPIQNVGAYGGEIADTLLSIEAYDLDKGEFVQIKSEDCGFGYRNSRFKKNDKGRFLITAITLKLKKELPHPPFYATVQQYFEAHDINVVTPKTLREAVVYIRESKLPDPKIVPNSGSFFTNPIVSNDKLKDLQKDFSTIPYWKLDENNVKLSAAWLIEQAGLKAYSDPETGISTWPSQPLVLINTNAKNTSDLLKFKAKTIEKIKHKFGVVLEQEPELLP